jgi:3-oxoacyl-[acyl-carrier-protein] synthase II
MTMQRDRIAVTGLGIVSALGGDAPSTFERLIRGDRALFGVGLFETAGARSHLAAEVTRPLPEAVQGSLELSRSDRLALCAAREALVNAGLASPAVRNGRLGLSLGGTTGGMAHAEGQLFAPDAAKTGLERARRLLSHPLSATAAALDRLIGPFSCTSTVCSACSSGAVALVQGVNWLLRGDAEQVLAGGVDALCRMTFAGFDALGALDPEPCRPFDVGRKGLTLGEGAAFLVLETEARARARGAQILCFLSGWAVGAEAHHVTHPEPSGKRAAVLMAQALATGGLTARDIDYVNAHGTGTLTNDAMEAKALLSLLGAEASRVRVSSSKGQLGHTLGAAGALEAAVTALALERGVAPPTGGLNQPEEPALRHVLGVGERAELRAALSSSFGFGGMNAVLLLERSDAAPRERHAVRRSYVISAAMALGARLDAGTPPSTVRAEPILDDPLARLDPERSRRFDRGAAFTTWAAVQALSVAGVSPALTGLAVGNAYGSVERSLAFLDRMRERGMRYSPPAEFPQLVHSALAGNASIYAKLEGPVAGVAAGTECGPSALACALGWLELGQAEAVVAGAIEPRDPVVSALLGRGGEAGEGGGFVLLEPDTAAARRGHRPLARLVAHVEERGAARDADLWRAPRDAARALVLFTPSHPALERWIAESSWSGVRRVDTTSTGLSHEALSGTALALGAQWLARELDELLLVSGGPGARFVTRLAAWEGAA